MSVFTFLSLSLYCVFSMSHSMLKDCSSSNGSTSRYEHSVTHSRWICSRAVRRRSTRGLYLVRCPWTVLLKQSPFIARSDVGSVAHASSTSAGMSLT